MGKAGRSLAFSDAILAFESCCQSGLLDLGMGQSGYKYALFQGKGGRPVAGEEWLRERVQGHEARKQPQEDHRGPGGA